MSDKGKQVLRERRANARTLEEQVRILDAKMRDMTANAGRIHSARLIRVRKQIDLLDTRIEEEIVKPDCDGQRVDRLASAISRLSEIERQLANRPMPGSLRPVVQTHSPKSHPTEPIPRSPAPAPPAAHLLSEPPDL
mgnify:CR=1 FL=1